MMREWIQYIQVYYTKIPLRLRDHRLLYVFVVFVMLLFLIPWNNTLKQRMQTVQDMQAAVYYLKNNIPSKKQQKSLNARHFLSYIAHQLQASEFKNFTYKIQQIGPKELQLTFERVPYTTLMSWLWSLSAAECIVFKQVDLTKTSTSGLVQARMLMLFDSTSAGSC